MSWEMGSMCYRNVEFPEPGGNPWSWFSFHISSVMFKGTWSTGMVFLHTSVLTH